MKLKNEINHFLKILTFNNNMFKNVFINRNAFFIPTTLHLLKLEL